MRQFAMFGLAAAILLAVGCCQAEARWKTHRGHYTNSDGIRVHVPHYGGASLVHRAAICGDGTASHSYHHRGTCSHHHGVRRWLTADISEMSIPHREARVPWTY